jgi:hypothetical protein
MRPCGRSSTNAVCPARRPLAYSGERCIVCKRSLLVAMRFMLKSLSLCVALVSAHGAPGAMLRSPETQPHTEELAAAKAALTLPQMPLHDPWIVADRARRVYYLYTSNIASMTGVAGVGTMVYTSRNLHDWTRRRVVFRLPRGIWTDAGG